eukprot:s3853_g3.t1
MAWSECASTAGSVSDFAIVDDNEWHPLLDEILEEAFLTLWLFLNVPERGELLAASWNVHEMIVELWLPRLVTEGRVSTDVALGHHDLE